ncbi:MAG TPA: TIGR03936 family radical SAM-associated protein [Pseudonocardiaceae bacterium]|nr:TIGR03936 family radical SAM-associated protein [Pseudonocardiaceae bacterium]
MRYAKRGKLRFASHRDIARTFERALRRAGVPMAYSQGFNPRPRVSWVGAAPTGTASEAEYVELAVVTPLDPKLLVSELDAALPPGIDVLEAVVASPGSLADRIDASQWRIELAGITGEQLRPAVEALLAAEEIEVDRMTKNGMRRMDVRPALVSVQVSASSDAEEGDAGAAPRVYGILDVVVRQTTPVVRPDDVLSAIRVVAALSPPEPVKATRLAQGRLDDEGHLADPFAPDRGTAEVPVAREPEPGQRIVERPAD